MVLSYTTNIKTLLFTLILCVTTYVGGDSSFKKKIQ
jgi:hypothetical protein